MVVSNSAEIYWTLVEISSTLTEIALTLVSISAIVSTMNSIFLSIRSNRASESIGLQSSNKKSGPSRGRLSDNELLTEGLVIHAFGAVSAAGSGSRLLLRDLADHRFSRQHQRCDRSGVLQRRASHLGGVDNAGRHQVFVFVGSRVVAE